MMLGDVEQRRNARARVNFVVHERMHDLIRRLGLAANATGAEVAEALEAAEDESGAIEAINELWSMWSTWKGVAMDPDQLDPIERILIEAEATERLARPDDSGRTDPTDEQEDMAVEAWECLDNAGATLGDLAISYGLDTPRGRYVGQIADLIIAAQGGLHLLPGIADEGDDE